MSDRFRVKRFHHVEFWCSDATNTARRFSCGLGMPIVARSDHSTGNFTHTSYLLRSGDLNFLFTAPYSHSIALLSGKNASIPTFSHSGCRYFSAFHGLAVRAIALEVEDAAVALAVSVNHGAHVSSPLIRLGNRVLLAEVRLYGNVVLRYISYVTPPTHPDPDPDHFTPPTNDNNHWFLPGFEPVDKMSSSQLDFGIQRLDQAVGNVDELAPVVEYVKGFTGFHTVDDVGTTESGGFNSVVLASNDEMVLLPMKEPVYRPGRKSQIKTYLEHNEGPGVQHLALVSEDIFRTLREMKRRSTIGGFEFMPPPLPTYYQNLTNRAGDVLTDEQIKECEELGILVDRDEKGTLLQISTKPVGDRPTIFIKIIQRVGCTPKDEEGKISQRGGCGAVRTH